MGQVYDQQYFTDVTERGKEMMVQMESGIRTALGLDPIGAEDPSDEELAAFFFQQQEVFPPQMFVFPDGAQVNASPWILALEYCENGREWLDRFNKFMSKTQPMNQPFRGGV